MPVMVAVESASKLVNICEQGSGGIKMPYTIQLVKQLKKELNLQKLMKEHKTTRSKELNLTLSVVLHVCIGCVHDIWL